VVYFLYAWAATKDTYAAAGRNGLGILRGVLAKATLGYPKHRDRYLDHFPRVLGNQP
jgi:hypothetical protein